MKIHLEEWFMSVSQFAKAVGVSPQAIRKGIKDKRIMASKVGKQWVLPKQLIEQWNNSSNHSTCHQCGFQEPCICEPIDDEIIPLT